MSEDNRVETVEELLSWTPVKSDDEVKRVICGASLSYRGNADDLVMAVGYLVLGRLFGWHVVRLLASRSGYARSQRILSAGLDGQEFKFSEWMRPEEPLARKSIVLSVIKAAGRFWDAIKGRCPDLPISRRRDLEG